MVAARNPNKTKVWATRAVQQYRYCLELKIDKNGKLAETNFAPSFAIHEIWRAHLCFIDKCQKGMICLTKGNGIIEHMPVHIKKSYEYYKRAHARHSQRMTKVGLAVDEEFWPTPLLQMTAPYAESNFHKEKSAWLYCKQPQVLGKLNWLCSWRMKHRP